MSLREVVEHTLETNPDMGIAAARLDNARFGIDVARAAQRPLITVSTGVGLENTYNEDSSTQGVNRQEAAISVRQPLFDFGARRLEVDRQRDLFSAAERRLERAANDVTLEVAEVYAQILSVDEQIGFAIQNVETHEQIARLVEASEEEGNATVADVERAMSRLEQARTILIDLKSQRENTIEAFVRLTELRPSKLSEIPRLGNAPASVDRLPVAVEDNPEVKAIRAEIEAFEKQLQTLRAGGRPTVGVELDANLRNNVGGNSGESQDARAMLRFRHTLYDGGLNRASINQINSRLIEAEQRLRRTRKEVEEDIRNNLRNNDTGRNKSSSLNERVAAASKVLELYIEQFKGGERTLFEVLDGQADLFSAQTERSANRYTTILTNYRTLATRGLLLKALFSPAGE
ncbi:MAG: TolC family protein [Pseudomonadota bacterium]